MDSCPGLVSNGSQSNINLTASTPTAQTTIQYAIISTAARHARTKRNRSLVWRESPVGRRRTLIMNGQNAYLCSDDYRDVIETLRNGACCGRAFMCTEKFERFWRPDHHVP